MADPERGKLNLEGAAKVVNQAKVLSKKNMKMLRKRLGAPKFVRHFIKLMNSQRNMTGQRNLAQWR